MIFFWSEMGQDLAMENGLHTLANNFQHKYYPSRAIPVATSVTVKFRK